jgi:hypothetical protein
MAELTKAATNQARAMAGTNRTPAKRRGTKTHRPNNMAVQNQANNSGPTDDVGPGEKGFSQGSVMSRKTAMAGIRKRGRKEAYDA